MIIVQITGGLGNQMFQYAIARKYHAKGFKTYLDLNFYKGDSCVYRKFELKKLTTNIPELPKHYYKYLYSHRLLWKIIRKINPLFIKFVKEEGMSFNKRYLNVNYNTVLSGYFQCPKYFIDIDSEIRLDFKFINSLSEKDINFLKNISNTESVSIHIRRGDFAQNLATNKMHGLLPLEYYRKAIALMNNKIPNPTYFVFSDDPDWVKEYFRNILDKFILVDNTVNNGRQDMYLMSSCKHNIIANSSFSWWAAWLNSNDNKIVVASKQWVVDDVLNSQLRDLVPKSWIEL